MTKRFAPVLCSLLIFIVSINFILIQKVNADEYNFLDEISSPFTQKTSRNVFIYGFGGSLIMYTFFKDPYIIKFQDRISKDKPLEGGYEFFDSMGRMIPNGIYAASFLIHGLLSKNSKSMLRAEKMLKASLYAGAATTILKRIFRENRPGGSSSKVSYPSGHATVAFAFAGVVSYEHAWYWGVGATTLASLVAIQRMGNNAHYLHDVIAGGALGYAFGWGISAYLDKVKSVSNSSFMVIPDIASKSLSANYIYRF